MKRKQHCFDRRGTMNYHVQDHQDVITTASGARCFCRRTQLCAKASAHSCTYIALTQSSQHLSQTSGFTKATFNFLLLHSLHPPRLFVCVLRVLCTGTGVDMLPSTWKSNCVSWRVTSRCTWGVCSNATTSKPDSKVEIDRCDIKLPYQSIQEE